MTTFRRKNVTRRALRANGISGGGYAPSLSPVWHWRAQDVTVDVDNSILTMPAVVGPTAVLVAGHPAYAIAAPANGITGIACPTVGARYETASAVHPGSHVGMSCIYVLHPDSARAAKQIQYLRYFGITFASAHIAFGVDFEYPGHFVHTGLDWVVQTTTNYSRNTLHTWGFTFDTVTGETIFYTNGVATETVMGATGVPITMGDGTLFSSWESTDPPISSWFRGGIYEGMEFARVLDATEMATEMGAFITKYAIDTTPFDPATLADTTMYCNQAGKSGPSGTVFTTELAIWKDQSADNNSPTIGTATAYPLDGGIVGRPNGYAFVDWDGVNDFMECGAYSNIVDADGYDQSWLVRINNCSVTIGASYVLPQIAGDASGFGGLVHYDNGDGTCTVRAWQWDGGDKFAEAIIPYGEWRLIRSKYDGATDILYIYVDGVEIDTTASVGSITNVAASFRLGRSSNNLYADMSLVEFHTSDEILSGGDATSLNDYFMEKYDL